MHATYGDWVQIQVDVLEPQERLSRCPDDTQKTSYEMRLKGFLLVKEASIGQLVRIRTLAGRVLLGNLASINPKYEYDFGEPILQLLSIGSELRELLREEE